MIRSNRLEHYDTQDINTIRLVLPLYHTPAALVKGHNSPLSNLPFDRILPLAPIYPTGFYIGGAEDGDWFVAFAAERIAKRNYLTGGCPSWKSYDT